MINFYIKSVTAIGKDIDKRPSTVEFRDGFNVISGPSNTGKSYIRKCIDYIFGGSRPFNPKKTGYDTIVMQIVTPRGEISFTRRFDSPSEVDIHSTDNKIKSQKYSVSHDGDFPLNAVWLNLMGMDFQPMIMRNEQVTKLIRMTWRSIEHMFFVEETRIGHEASVLKGKGVSDTAFLASLLVLITGKDFSRFIEQETKEVKDAKKKGAVEFANKAISRLAEQKVVLAERMANTRGIDINSEMERITRQISELETKIIDAQGQSRRLLKEIYATNEHLAQCEVMLDRHRALREKYESDINRLSFITDGDIRKPLSSETDKCPYCDSEIHRSAEDSLVDDAEPVASDILEQLAGLRKTEAAALGERETLLEKINELKHERSEVERLINYEWKPKTQELRQALAFYSDTVRLRKEITDVERFASELTYDLRDWEDEDSNKPKFKPRDELKRDILDIVDEYLFGILTDCKYEPLVSARFDKEKLAMVINGNEQSENGEGYRAFLNTVLALTWMKYLSVHAVYKPGFLLIDKPIKPLMEPAHKKSSQTMRTALFEYFLKNQEYGQVIILENEIPEIDYSNAREIYFTRSEDDGRYGFLIDYRGDGMLDEADTEEDYN